MHNEFKNPVGAIWIRGYNLRERVKKMFEDHNVNITDGKLDEIFQTNHTLSVKVTALREKFIAIENKRKRAVDCSCRVISGRKRLCNKCSNPDYFLHVYQEYTGAAPVFPFGNDGSGEKSQTPEVPVLEQNGEVGAKREGGNR